MNDYDRIIADMRADLVRRTARIVRETRTRCGRCWTPLHHAGYRAPGGIPVTLTTCPTCDRYDERIDR